MLIGMITVFLIVCYTLWVRPADQALVSSPYGTGQAQPVVLDQPVGKDPFKEVFEKQQQRGSAQAAAAQDIQPVQIVYGNKTVTVKPGTDPFKAFLELQSKTKSEDAAISPFGR